MKLYVIEHSILRVLKFAFASRIKDPCKKHLPISLNAIGTQIRRHNRSMQKKRD